MKRNVFVLLAVLSLALIGTVVALPGLYRSDTAVDGTTRAQVIDTLLPSNERPRSA